jgi:hypothetical protein
VVSEPDTTFGEALAVGATVFSAGDEFGAVRTGARGVSFGKRRST